MARQLPEEDKDDVDNGQIVVTGEKKAQAVTCSVYLYFSNTGATLSPPHNLIHTQEHYCAFPQLNFTWPHPHLHSQHPY